LYFVADTKSIVIGFIICYREVLIKQHKIKQAALPQPIV
jgi:hypothetical protein